MKVEIEIKEKNREISELMDLHEVLNQQLEKYERAVSHGIKPVERLYNGSIEDLRDASDYPKQRKIIEKGESGED